MLDMAIFLRLLLAPLLALAAATAHADEPALLTAFVAGRSLDETTERLKQAIAARNFSFVRQQAIDSRLVPADWEAKSVRIVYFCNFGRMDAALRRDPRTAQLMPCRITLIEGRNGVDLVAVNPAWVSTTWQAPALQQDCTQLKEDYLAILEETAL
jgi:uncharacterized protein (DUF302 family)